MATGKLVVFEGVYGSGKLIVDVVNRVRESLVGRGREVYEIDSPDTGRARVVRRDRNPLPACTTCPHRADCLALSPEPTLLWQWQRTGVLDRRKTRGADYAGPERRRRPRCR